MKSTIFTVLFFLIFFLLFLIYTKILIDINELRTAIYYKQKTVLRRSP